MVQFFVTLADQEAGLRQQQALEATLLRQATAAIWSARGRGRAATAAPQRARASGDMGDGGSGSRTSPLGPRLAWLACEELTAFFGASGAFGAQHNGSASASNANANATARLHGGRGGRYPSVAVAGSPLDLLQPPPSYSHPGTASRGMSGANQWRGGGGGGGLDNTPPPQRKEQLIKEAVLKMGPLNLVLPATAHRGTVMDPNSACGFCGLPLSVLDGDGDDNVSGDGFGYGYGDDNGGAELVVLACGHGFHARCLSLAGGRGGAESMSLPLVCPQCM